MAVKTFTTEVLTSADTNTYLANSGLVYVTSTSATSGSSLSVNNCFTSTYSAYRIVINRATLAGVSGLSMKMRASGADQSTLYYGIRTGNDYSTGAASTAATSNGSEWNLPLISDTTSAACVIDVYNPRLSLKTEISAQGSDSRTTGIGALIAGGMLNNTTAYDGFTILSGSAYTNISLTVYGYRIA
jgi:hypothetical protein